MAADPALWLPPVERIAEVVADALVEPGYWENVLLSRSSDSIERRVQLDRSRGMYRAAAQAALNEVAAQAPGYVRRLLRTVEQLQRERDDARFELNRLKNAEAAISERGCARGGSCMWDSRTGLHADGSPCRNAAQWAEIDADSHFERTADAASGQDGAPC